MPLHLRELPKGQRFVLMRTGDKFVYLGVGVSPYSGSYEENADVVGAINILARGHRVLACGEPVQSGRSMKQEPTEAIKASRRDAVGIAVL